MYQAFDPDESSIKPIESYDVSKNSFRKNFVNIRTAISRGVSRSR